MISIDFQTLILTRNEFLKINNNEIIDEISRVLKNNEIEKPIKHNRINDKSSSHFIIDIKSEFIEEIIELFGDLETSTLSDEYESTSESIKFSRIVNKWTNILES